MSKKKSIYNIVDLFAGAGGFGLGFQLASKKFKITHSLEIDQWAVDTLRENKKKGHKIIKGDIKKFNTKEKILKVCKIKPTVIIGGPPCQGFSFAGLNDINDPRNTLFKNFAKWVKILQPTIFIIENVKGILTRRNERGEKVIEIIRDTFEKLGYTLDIWKLNAADYGVPQNRERVFVIGNRFNKHINSPKRTHYMPSGEKKMNGKIKSLSTAITVSKAISDLPRLKAGEGNEDSFYSMSPKSKFQFTIRKKQNILYNHVSMAHTNRIVERFKKIQTGQTLDEVPEELKVRERNGNGKLSLIEFESNYRHLKPNNVSFTIPASFYSNFIHPNQPRNITSREAARLQSFPDWYKFKGKRTQISSKLLIKLGKQNENYLSQYNQIGNAVPPLLAKAIAKQILKFLRNQI